MFTSVNGHRGYQSSLERPMVLGGGGGGGGEGRNREDKFSQVIDELELKDQPL